MDGRQIWDHCYAGPQFRTTMCSLYASFRPTISYHPSACAACMLADEHLHHHMLTCPCQLAAHEHMDCPVLRNDIST
jgi:hypothetical protein